MEGDRPTEKPAVHEETPATKRENSNIPLRIAKPKVNSPSNLSRIKPLKVDNKPNVLLNKSEDVIGNYKQTINQLQNRIHSLEIELKEQKRISNDYSKNVQNRRKDEYWSKQLDDMKKKYTVLQQDYLEKQKEIDSKSNEITKFRTNYESKCKELETKIAELTHLKANKQELRNLLRACRDEIIQKNHKIHQLSKKISSDEDANTQNCAIL